MITLFRMIRLWQLRTKWKLAIYQFIDQQATELLKNPEEIEKKFVSALAQIIHDSNQTNTKKHINHSLPLLPYSLHGNTISTVIFS